MAGAEAVPCESTLCSDLCQDSGRTDPQSKKPLFRKGLKPRWLLERTGALYGQLGKLLQRHRSHPALVELDTETKSAQKPTDPEVLPRASPYVGFQRHAPPSPMLTFKNSVVGKPTPDPSVSAVIPPLMLPKSSLSSGLDFMMQTCFELAPVMPEFPGKLPEEAWSIILSDIIEVPLIGRLSCLARGFPEVVQSAQVWQGRPVHIHPEVLLAFAPKLGVWLPAWSSASKLVLPRSSQLLAEVSRRAPHIPVEIAWRFDQQLKGQGVEVIKSGSAARRIEDEELVVLGDAPLPAGDGRMPYLEVCLDVRGEALSSDDVNDFGLGVTACDPQEFRELQLGSVADEVPRSWVVDFTQSSVVLSVNNQEAAKGFDISASTLMEGDRVGLRITPEAVEVFINGLLRQHLVPAPEERVPTDVGLFPVLDLYGCTVQLSRTWAEVPSP